MIDAGSGTLGAAGAASLERRRRVDRRYLAAAAAFLVFLGAMFALEQAGLSRRWIAAVFLLGPVVVYAGIGLAARTMQPAEYFVAGRRVPAVYNGMAIGADWMSVASFMSLTGILYITGFGGLAYVLGWTGGFCLIAFGLAPYLRKFGQYTIPDFLGERGIAEGALQRLSGEPMPTGLSYYLSIKFSRSQEPALTSLTQWLRAAAR